MNLQERSLLVTDLGEQNQRLGKQLAEAEEAALDLRAQVGPDHPEGDVDRGDGECGGGRSIGQSEKGYLRDIYVCVCTWAS